MSSRQLPANDDIDLMSLFGALRRSLPKLLLYSAIVGALTFAFLSLMAPRYSSETQVAIVSKRTNPFPEQSGDRQGGDSAAARLDREAINTHVRALSATSLLLSVARELGLEEKPEFNAAVGPIDTLDGLLRLAGIGRPSPNVSDEDRVLNEVASRLQVSAARESRFITIRFTSIDPQLAATFSNQLADAYRRSLVAVPVDETNDVVQALLPKIEQLNREVVEAEADVERFRARTDRLLSGPNQIPLQSQRLGALSEELSRAEGARSQAESRWRSAQEMRRSGSADVLPEVQQSNVIQGLISQRVRLERQVAEASATLLPAHPRMRQLSADLAGLRTSIDREIAKVVESLEKEFRASQLRVNDIARQMSELKARVVDTSGDDAELRVLESKATSKRAELARLQRQLEDNKTLVVTRTVPVEAQIVSEARPSGVPSFPKKGPITGLVMAATFLLGLALSAAGEIIARSSGGVRMAAAPGAIDATRARGQTVGAEPGLSPKASSSGTTGTRTSDRRRQADEFDDLSFVDDLDDLESDISIVSGSTRGGQRAPEADTVGSGVGVEAERARKSGLAAMFTRRGSETSTAGRTSVAPENAAAEVATGSALARLARAARGGRGGRSVDTTAGERTAASGAALRSGPDRTAEAAGKSDGGRDHMGEIARHIASNAEAGLGYRTMIVGDTSNLEPVHEAVALVRELARGDRHVVLLDCGLDGSGISDDLGMADALGFVDLVMGGATFEDVVKPLLGHTVHVVPCGRALEGDPAELDADMANLVLDALDEAYDHVVVSGPLDDARFLFELIQGRFDAGITVSEHASGSVILDENDNTFLGFEVSDIDVIRYERSGASAFSTRRVDLREAEARA
ncbi:MAG: Wzz/FepE/Etk N-terminal domain-containing protein [Hyphomicrobiaceae bacterium]